MPRVRIRWVEDDLLDETLAFNVYLGEDVPGGLGSVSSCVRNLVPELPVEECSNLRFEDGKQSPENEPCI